MGALDDFFSALWRPSKLAPGPVRRPARLVEKQDSWSVDVPIGGTAEIVGFYASVPLHFRKAGNYCGTLLAWGNISWQILENGAVRRTLRDPNGFAGLPGSIMPLSIPSGNRVSVNGVNNTANIVSMGITLLWDEEFRS